jgi:ABC-type polysaccharide/polyol phosphate export permease
MHQLGITFRLHYRNKMALGYSLLFPLIFFVVFWVLYRYDSVPMARHVGELLTVTALSGACFGLPTGMVSERERGVWRRYRLAPVPTGSLIANTFLARYFILIIAAVAQIGLAMAIGMPLPAHPFDLWVAFTFVAFAFMGLGLVIAMLADNVPAVQALGQCIFLPMLVIGGVAVRLESLPVWAQHVSAFFPGRYAVEAIQSTVTGEGLSGTGFAVLALLIIGAAACLAGIKMFRWDAQQRFTTQGGKGWLGVALASWLAVGIIAESGGLIAIVNPQPVDQPPSTAQLTPLINPDSLLSEAEIQALMRDSLGDEPVALAQPDSVPEPPTSGTGTEAEPSPGESTSSPETPAENTPSESTPPDNTEPDAPAAPWEVVTLADIERDIRFTSLPDDAGVVSPVAAADEPMSPEIATQLQCIRMNLPFWRPGRVSDPVQRARNYLYVAAVPDVFQMEEIERFVPRVVFDQIRFSIPREDLTKILYWIAMNPDEGDDVAATQLPAVCIESGAPSDTEQLRERVTFYALKLLGRLTGDIPAT